MCKRRNRNLVMMVGLGVAAAGGFGCAMLQGKQAAKAKAGAADEGGPAKADNRPPKVASITEWEDENGVKPRALYFTLANRCKERMDMKIADKTPDGKYRDHSSSRSLDPLPKGAAGRGTRDGIQEYHVGWMGSPISANYREPKPEKPTIWLRQGPAGDYYEAPIDLEYGKAYKLQIDPGCKTVSARKDEEPILGCYHWQYIGKCNRRPESARAPYGCEPGSFGVEGDVKNCSFTTPEGNECKVYYTGFGAGCDIR